MPVKPVRVAEYFCERPDRENLYSQQREDHSENHGVNVQHHVGRNLAWSPQQPKHECEPGKHQRAARQQEKPVRRVQQHEPQAAPAVAKTAEMRRAPALVRPQNDGDLCHAGPDLRGLDDHLQSEFHP